MTKKFRPTCRLCGRQHFAHEAHVWPDVESTPKQKVESTPRKPAKVESTHTPVESTPCAECARLRAALDEANAILADYRDREARQRKAKREHMARKRATR